MEWLMTQVVKGVSIIGDMACMEEPYLVGKCNENGHNKVFITKKGEHTGSCNTVLFIRIVVYIECIYDRNMVDRI